MNKQNIEKSLQHIESQLQDGHIALGCNNENELKVVEAAIGMFRTMWETYMTQYVR